MTSQQRIVANTAAQYTRTVISVCLSLYSTRLILSALGQSDFGIYSVVAGVVAMLSFMTNALVTTTQRYLSYNHGKNDKQRVYQVFGNSVLLHLLIGLVVLILLAALAYPVIYKMLHIDAERQTAAMWVYMSASVMLLITFVTAPFRALFIARENIVYISIIDVLDGVMKLLIALLLVHASSGDKLVSYSLLLVGISLFNLLAFGVYALARFDECHLPRLSEWDSEHIRGLSSFAGWTIYGTGCVVARNQGIAILVNIFCSTIANAAYGIAQQVSGAVAFVSVSIVNAINPQIMKAEGAGDREKMLRLAEYESKYASLLLGLVSIPLIFEMESVLRLWLTDVPEYAVGFCQLMLLAAVFDQLSIGLTSANQAIGRIKVYTLVFYTFKLVTLLGVWVCLLFGVDVVTSLWCYVVVELLGSFLRLVLLKRQAKISILHFAGSVFARLAFPLIVITAISYVCVTHIDHPYRFVLTMVLSVAGGITAALLTALDKSERDALYTLLHRK
ncbi:MAG: MATE family efflux transporter [Paludibacteraceae bacterium]|nr:MATE family efflux transporter [Paludibacteraceae bacterium]